MDDITRYCLWDFCTDVVMDAHWSLKNGRLAEKISNLRYALIHQAHITRPESIHVGDYRDYFRQIAKQP